MRIFCQPHRGFIGDVILSAPPNRQAHHIAAPGKLYLSDIAYFWHVTSTALGSGV
jgi:hypothetical protein